MAYTTLVQGYDSLGVSAMDCSLTTNSGNCTFKYTEADIVAGYDTIYRNKNKFHLAVNSK